VHGREIEDGRIRQLQYFLFPNKTIKAARVMNENHGGCEGERKAHDEKKIKKHY
jgi:hypothetical protein